MNWKLKQNGRGRPYLAVEYDSSAHNWDAAIAAGLAGAGVKRNQLAVIIASPATSTRAGRGDSREGAACSTQAHGEAPGRAIGEGGAYPPGGAI